jgi:hypothetical protein
MMGTPISGGAVGCVLLATLFASGIGAHAAPFDARKLILTQPVGAVADTQAGARRQGAVKVGGIDWACNGTRCSTSTPPAALAAPVAVCQGLAREVGAIRSFTVGNRLLNGKELQQCNSVVPPAPAAGSAGPRTAVPFSPVALRTPQLTLTGTGVAEIRHLFTPVAVRTPQLTLTGIGVAEIRYRFTPVAVRTPQLTITGTGRSE